MVDDFTVSQIQRSDGGHVLIAQAEIPDIEISYDEESCRMVGEIVNVSAEESVLDKNGKIDPGKLQPITFDPVNNAYLKLGEKVGNAFRDGLTLK